MLKSLALKFPPIKRLWDDRLALIAVVCPLKSDPS